ncbi:hypothetical protein ACFP2F_07755 [Hymenobacter artigasi]|uniref:GAF domain-containing protein n=1 Tax=Hymenobacter artigasi TaxID=2719616 RepID=A0ABX1HFX0_9BACT|nr:hypothetical protein [Hymenobacter artigasi]NKI89146.1 hypothetical protein [Hymenobacter artigasi]
MEFNGIIKRLESFGETINRAVIGAAIFEGIIVTLIGIVSNNLSTENETLNRLSLYAVIFLGITYLLILFFKTAYTANYPGSITNELKSERELQELRSEAERKNTINDFLVQTMQRLNGQTCSLNIGDDTHLCDGGISKGVRELIEPVIDNTFFLLNTINTKFTIGLYLNGYSSMDTPNHWESGLITIDDKLDKRHCLPKELFNITGVNGEALEIQTAIRQSFNNQQFVFKNYETNGESFSIICSNMPVACNENDGLGVLFIISKNVSSLPSDLSTHLKIFGRVIANWVYRYNECVSNRLTARQERSVFNSISLPTPPEALAPGARRGSRPPL